MVLYEAFWLEDVCLVWGEEPAIQLDGGCEKKGHERQKRLRRRKSRKKKIIKSKSQKILKIRVLVKKLQISQIYQGEEKDISSWHLHIYIYYTSVQQWTNNCTIYRRIKLRNRKKEQRRRLEFPQSMTYSPQPEADSLESLADTYKKLNEGEAAASVSRG